MTPEQFRAIREKLGKTQAEMGLALGDEHGGYSKRTVQLWEAGAGEIPPAVRRLTRYIAAEAGLPEGVKSHLFAQRSLMLGAQ